jgi:hypothetical protein
MRPYALALIGLLALSGVACQSRVPAPPPRAEEGPATRARAALEAGRYTEAANLFRQALERTPESVSLRYGLAVALSYIDRDAAGREFQWVLAAAQPGTREAVESRLWLARAGLLPRESPVAGRSPQAERQVGHAVLTGRALFAENGGKAEPMRRLQLFLVGQPDGPTKEERYNLRTTEDGSFTFPDVVPGPYMITNRVAGQPIWRLRVELKPGEEKQLDLMNDNSVAARDDFPQPR